MVADEPTDPVVILRAAVETLVFAPIGFGAALVDDAPRAIRRVRQELRNARFIGRLTVEQGAVRHRAEATIGRESVGSGSAIIEVDNVVSGEPERLAIDGYDAMPAIEIVARLESLTPAQLAVIADHETANRHRRTVLGKIAQLVDA